jgi:putative transposase
LLSWRLSNTLDAGFCVDCLQDALGVPGQADLSNTDQGSQFPSDSFTVVLFGRRDRHQQGQTRRVLVDNIFVERLWRTVKDEDVDLKGCASLPKLRLGLTEYFAFYNGGRPYQRLGNRTPDVVRRSGAGGGARIVDPRRAKPLQLTQSVPLKLGENCPGQGVHFRQARE